MAELSIDRIDALLSDLDFIAREYDVYEYGLPMHGADQEDGPINKLRAAVREWAAGVRADDCTSCEGTGSGGMGSGCTDCLGTGVDPMSDTARGVAPTRRPLTDDRIDELWEALEHKAPVYLARAVEREHGITNGVALPLEEQP